MNTEAKKPKIFENALFAFMGAITAAVVSLGTFGAVDNRAPASISASDTSADAPDFDARIYMAD